MQVKKMVGLLGVRQPRSMRDSDGDGVPNILDCKPYDKNKQGIIHDLHKKYQESRVAAITRKKEETRIRREAAWSERKKQIAKTARHRERERGKRTREGGYLSQFAKGFQRPAPKKPTYKPRKIKKGKKQRIKRAGVAPRQPQSLGSFMESRFSGL